MTVKAYVVEHTMMGVHRAGDVVTFVDHKGKELEIDVERLLRIGAVREASSAEAKSAVRFGETSEDVPRVFPAVPFQQIGVSPDPQRSEASPTNPQDGVPAEATPVGGTVSDKPKLKK